MLHQIIIHSYYFPFSSSLPLCLSFFPSFSRCLSFSLSTSFYLSLYLTLSIHCSLSLSIFLSLSLSLWLSLSLSISYLNRQGVITSEAVGYLELVSSMRDSECLWGERELILCQQLCNLRIYSAYSELVWVVLSVQLLPEYFGWRIYILFCYYYLHFYLFLTYFCSVLIFYTNY